MTSALSILRAFAEEIAAKQLSCGNREAMDKARAALEAAAKAPESQDGAGGAVADQRATRRGAGVRLSELHGGKTGSRKGKQLMGDARKNVMSRQYAGEQLPASIIGGDIKPRVGVSVEWLEAHPVVEGQEPEQVPDSEQNIEWRLTGLLVLPSALVDRSRWPNYTVDLGVVLEMKLDEFKRLAMTPRP